MEDKLELLNIFEVMDGGEEENVSNVSDENVFAKELLMKQGSSREVTATEDGLT